MNEENFNFFKLNDLLFILLDMVTINYEKMIIIY